MKTREIMVMKKNIMIDSTATGKKARAARIKKGYTLREIAKLMIISSPYLSDLEKGKRAWNEEIIARFINAMERI